ncbi:MAG TPA: DUF971 domain-containing protein [Tepidisphaeraceae bacterium]|nr:DUF971 domain-containing protein [Tepidisphaeraceae bacterium]
MLTPQTTPVRLDLKRDEKLEVEWQDGLRCTYPLTLLRSMCPCAMCREQRESAKQRKSLLTVLPGNYTGTIAAVAAQLVGNYAIKIEWSDQHESGIYSFQYLREICPTAKG